MKRRTALGAIIFYSLGANTLVSCKDKYQAIKDLKLQNIKLNNHQLELIDELCNIIFPAHHIPEFKNHSALLHLLTMTDECVSPEMQKDFLAGLSSFEEDIQKKFSKPFEKLSSEQKLYFVKEVNKSQKENDLTFSFFKTIKQRTIEYYTTTEYHMRKIQMYEMAPGRFLGCVKIDQRQTKNL